MTSRRVALAAPVLALAAACGGKAAPPGAPARAAANDAARDRVLAAERDLVSRYDAALQDPAVAADSALTARLTAIRAEHADHLAAVGEGYARAAAVPAPPTSASASATPSPGASPSVITPHSVGSAPPAGDAKALVSALAQAEQDASSRLTADVLAGDGATALLFASIAASEAGHAALLLGGAA